MEGDNGNENTVDRLEGDNTKCASKLKEGFANKELDWDQVAILGSRKYIRLRK